jgi:hypothetical protein
MPAGQHRTPVGWRENRMIRAAETSDDHQASSAGAGVGSRSVIVRGRQNPSRAPTASGSARRLLTEPARSPGIRSYQEPGREWTEPRLCLTFKCQRT